MEVYSLEGALRSFFEENVSPSRQECDDFARSLLGGRPVAPFAIQGSFSYTVFSPQDVADIRPGGDGSSQPNTNVKIVQFRLNKSKIDIYVAQLAKAIHGDMAAETDYCGEIGQDASARLSVYLIQKLPGVTYIEMGNFSVEMKPEQASKQVKIIEDFARYEASKPVFILLFFAASWLHPQLITQDQRENKRATISSKLYVLTSTLPPRFTATIFHVHRELDELFHPRYPQVLTHGDLCEMNILVSPTTGGVTGIIDWAEAEVLPFGLALYGLENLLGNMGPEGWRYFKIRDDLEQIFWDQFWDCIAGTSAPPDNSIRHIRHTITIARQVGVLMRYGFKWEDGIVEKAVTEEDAGSLAYLDALLFTGERD